MASNAAAHYTHLAPDYRLEVEGKDISAAVQPRLISLTLTEGRANSADQLEIELDDADGQLAIPRKEAEIALAIGWKGQQLVDKGSFVVDEAEHSGTPDRVTIRARAADLGGEIRTRKEKSWHATTLGTVLAELAQRNSLTHKIDKALAAIKVDHLDQTNESDMHLITRLARKHDAVATVKKKHLLFMPITGTTTSQGQRLPTHRRRGRTSTKNSIKSGSRPYLVCGSSSCFDSCMELVAWLMRYTAAPMHAAQPRVRRHRTWPGAPLRRWRRGCKSTTAPPPPSSSSPWCNAQRA